MRIRHSVIVSSPGLLPMSYTVSELAGELRVPDRTLRDWLDAGAPHQRDFSSQRCSRYVQREPGDDQRGGGRHGKGFAEWVQRQRKPKRERKLDNGSAYCLRCKKAVKLTEPRTRHIKAKLYLITGLCPQCGATINRGARNGKKD